EISNRYSEEFMDGLDLGSSLMPPKDLMTSARVMESRCGSILTDSGCIQMTAGQVKASHSDLQPPITHG
ncbi:5598_t:CDS:2, partial [Ambispora leptoticha]